MKVLFLTSLLLSSFSVFAGCCYTPQGLCCSGSCQNQCSGKDATQIKGQFSCNQEETKVKEEKKESSKRYSLITKA